jgi:hypothetical protein
MEDTEVKKQREVLEIMFSNLDADVRQIASQDNFIVLFSFLR